MLVSTPVRGTHFKVATFHDHVAGELTLDNLAEFITIISGEKYDPVPANIFRLQKCLSEESDIWPLLVTKTKRKQIISDCVKKCESFLESTSNSAYFEKWAKIRHFLNGLGDITINEKIWNLSMENSKLSEKAKRHNVTDQVRIEYSMSSSSTGRLTITSGLNFLTLPRSCRNSLVPVKKDSVIVSCDFISLEPRVALWTAGTHENVGDVYEVLMEICQIEKRSSAKLATISALYGATSSRLIQTVGSKRKAQGLIENVQRFFCVKEIEKKLENQALAGLVRNGLGRPLREATKQPRVRVNHYIQSTAAEIANIMFSDLCSRCAYAKPLMVIHDALIVEVPEAEYENFKKESEILFYDSYSFPTKLELLNI
jgi:hypothetical protein